VLVQFWTFTCINWLRTLPYVRAWYERYRDDGLVVLGVHTPEFDVEQDVDNVRRAAGELRVEFPIAVDSDYGVWSAFANHYWPALYFADAEGRIRHHRFGEGEYEYSELVLQTLLEDAGSDAAARELVSLDPQGLEKQPDWDQIRSPETYIGSARAPGYDAPELAGDWTLEPQAAVLNAADGRIRHRFQARDLNLVLAPGADDRPVRFRVALDGAPPGAAHGVDTAENGEGMVTEPRLYQLIRQHGRVARRAFDIAFLDPGVRAYVFTFG
jgi:thiol-disulfide isomerase/thioredoxin